MIIMFFPKNDYFGLLNEKNFLVPSSQIKTIKV